MSEPSTYCEINLKAIRANTRELKRLAKRNKFELPTRPAHVKFKLANHILAVIKADAYGHGMREVAAMLDGEGIEYFAVSDVKEGKELRSMKVTQPILLFESTLPAHVGEMVKYQLTPSLCDYPMAKALNEKAAKAKKCVDVHIKVDTGMGRLGIWHEQAFHFVQRVHALKNLRIMGIFTHFPAADTDAWFTQEQIDKLYTLVKDLDTAGIIIPYIHAANSMGLAGYKTHVLNLTRPGLMIYGLHPHPSLHGAVKLKPAMSVKSQVIFVKTVEKGQSISYGRTFFTKRRMTVATVPIGYADGYFRAFSNKAHVLIGGHRCQVLGRVTMDQIVVDVSHCPRVKVGSPVVVMGRQGKEEVNADELAHHADTINYEIVCSFGSRLVKQYKT